VRLAVSGLGTPAVVIVGGMLGLQARLNGELGGRLHSAVAAAAVSFSVGTVVLLPVAAVVGRAGVQRLRAARVRWWWWLGGLAGAAVVGSTAKAVPVVGVALATVCIVAGTAAGALFVDRLGLGPGGRQAVTVLRAAGATLAVAAVVLSAAGDGHRAVRPGLFSLLFAAGAASTFQQAANGQIRRVADSVVVASLVSFLGGTVALLAIAAARGDLSGHPWPAQWWLYLGGLLGAGYIAVAAASVARLGVLQVSLATVAGQLGCAVLLDAVWPPPGARLQATTVAGAALTFAAVWLSGRRRARA
jgi:transporter family-2 protein